jgi:acetylglutamate synthase
MNQPTNQTELEEYNRVIENGFKNASPVEMIDIIESYQHSVTAVIEGLRTTQARSEIGQISLLAMESLYTGLEAAVIWITHHHNLEELEAPTSVEPTGNDQL